MTTKTPEQHREVLLRYLTRRAEQRGDSAIDQAITYLLAATEVNVADAGGAFRCAGCGHPNWIEPPPQIDEAVEQSKFFAWFKAARNRTAFDSWLAAKHDAAARTGEGI